MRQVLIGRVKRVIDLELLISRQQSAAHKDIAGEVPGRPAARNAIHSITIHPSGGGSGERTPRSVGLNHTKPAKALHAVTTYLRTNTTSSHHSHSSCRASEADPVNRVRRSCLRKHVQLIGGRSCADAHVSGALNEH